MNKREEAIENIFNKLLAVWQAGNLTRKGANPPVEMLKDTATKIAPPELTLISQEKIEEYFEEQVPEAQRNELFNLLVIDYATELQMAAQAQLDHDRRTLEEKEWKREF